MPDLWADLEAESRKPGPTMTITKAQYGALRAAAPHDAGLARDGYETCPTCWQPVPVPQRGDHDYGLPLRAAAPHDAGAAREAACLTCGTAIPDPTAGACHECGAEDCWIGSQWLTPSFPQDVLPFALSRPMAETPARDELAAIEARDKEAGEWYAAQGWTDEQWRANGAEALDDRRTLLDLIRAALRPAADSRKERK